MPLLSYINIVTLSHVIKNDACQAFLMTIENAFLNDEI